MALNFPHNPNVNDTFTDSGKTWVWDGTTWKIYSSTTSGIGLGNLSVTTTSVGTAALSYNNTTGAFTYTPPNLSSYLTSVPTATTTTLGLVKIDGTTITMNNGVISGANTYSLPTASTTVLGGVKIDGTTITISNGVISGAPSVPTTITVADESADDSCYPLFVTNSTGNLAPKTGTNLAFNSSSGQLEAGSFKKTGGSSSEFLKADGSIDSSSYLANTGVQNLQGQLVVDYINFNDSFIQLNNSLGGQPLTIRGNGTGGSLHVTLDDDVTIVGDLTVQGATSFASGSNVPVGGIIMWSGTVASIPTGWALCDGTGTTPDLRGRFVVGHHPTNSDYDIADTGGSADAVVVEHTHTTNIDGGGVFPGLGNNTLNYGGAGQYPYTANFAIDTEGVSGTNANLPPYYALCFIMKT